MTVWAVRQGAEEGRLRLSPLEGLPDMSTVTSQALLRQALQRLHPDAPPEAIGTLAERLRAPLLRVQPEDVVAVPIPGGGIQLGEVTGAVFYEAGAHFLPVAWREKPVRLWGKPLLAENAPDFAPLTDARARQALLRRMPYRFNRFARWQWVLLLLLGLRLAHAGVRLWRREFGGF